MVRLTQIIVESHAQSSAQRVLAHLAGLRSCSVALVSAVRVQAQGLQVLAAAPGVDLLPNRDIGFIQLHELVCNSDQVARSGDGHVGAAASATVQQGEIFSILNLNLKK